MRPSTDDFALFCTLRDKGFAGSFEYNFYHFNFRHAALQWVNSVFTLQDISSAYFFMVPVSHLLMLAFLFWSLFKLSGMVAEKYFSKALSTQEKFTCAAFFMATLYFCTSQSIEIWTYMAVYACYLYPVIAALAGLALIAEKKSSLVRNILLFFFAFWSGSGMEVFSIAMITVLLSKIIVCMKIFGAKKFFDHPANKKTLIALMGVLLSFVLVIVAPGTHLRAGVESDLAGYRHGSSLLDIAENLVRSYAGIKIFFIFLLAAFWFSVGRKWKNNNSENFPANKKIFLFLLGMIFLILVLTLFVSQFVFKGALPDRCWFPLNLFVSVLICLFFLYLGFSKGNKIKIDVDCVSAGLLIGTFTWYGFVQLPRAVLYAGKFDERIKTIQTYKEKRTLELEALPPSGIIVSSELSKDSLHNDLFEAAYGLKFHVRLKTRDN